MPKRRDSDYLETLWAALLRCRRCGWWTGWRTTKEDGVKHVDTVCSVCSSRLRFSYRHESWVWRNNVPTAYAKGRGMWKKDDASVMAYSIPRRGWRFDRRKVKDLAIERNKELQRRNWVKDGIDPKARTVDLPGFKMDQFSTEGIHSTSATQGSEEEIDDSS